MITVSEEINNKEEKNSDDGIVLKKHHIVIILIAVVLMIFGGVLAGLNWNNRDISDNSPSESSSQNDANVDLDPNAYNWNGSKPAEPESSSPGIKIPGYPSITIAADKENVKMALLNPEGNPCYFKFEIVLKDSGETIYESKYVEPGKAITDVELKKPLSKGEYPATIKISTLSLDGQNPLNGANVETVLIAK